MRRSSIVLLPALASMLVATAARAAPSSDDPDERMNRVGFAIYEALDRELIRPAALAYQRALPGPVQRGIEHVLTNLHEPVVAVNDLLQGRFRKARSAVIRFAINSTDGVLGVFDVAAKLGVPPHDNGFALTLGRAGVKPGPFLFIPIAGPTTLRDAIGNGVDDLMDPLQWFVGTRLASIVLTRTVVSGLDQRASADAGLQALVADATDPYATIRSVYLQNQQARIEDRPPGAAPVLPTFDEDSAPAEQPTVSLGFDGGLADAQTDAGGVFATGTVAIVEPAFAPEWVDADAIIVDHDPLAGTQFIDATACVPVNLSGRDISGLPPGGVTISHHPALADHRGASQFVANYGRSKQSSTARGAGLPNGFANVAMSLDRRSAPGGPVDSAVDGDNVTDSRHTMINDDIWQVAGVDVRYPFGAS